MRPRKFILHLVLMGGITALIVVCIVYPFLPGSYDRLAVGLSTMAQVLGVFGLLLVPVGALWLAHGVWRQARSRRTPPAKALEYAFALAAVVAASLVAVVVALVAVASVGLAFGLLTFALWLYVVSRLWPGLKALKKAARENFNPLPLYLIFIPIAVVLFQRVLAAPITEISRDHAIAMSAELIHDIEAFRAEYGRYPRSLLAVWKDYFPSVVGTEQFHYEPSDDAYNLFFEQPRLLFDDFGVREFVVYNPLDEQVMISHDSWILILGEDAVEAAQGWFAAHDASRPHWKYFWFD